MQLAGFKGLMHRENNLMFEKRNSTAWQNNVSFADVWTMSCPRSLRATVTITEVYIVRERSYEVPTILGAAKVSARDLSYKTKPGRGWTLPGRCSNFERNVVMIVLSEIAVPHRAYQDLCPATSPSHHHQERAAGLGLQKAPILKAHGRSRFEGC